MKAVRAAVGGGGRGAEKVCGSTAAAATRAQGASLRGKRRHALHHAPSPAVVEDVKGVCRGEKRVHTRCPFLAHAMIKKSNLQKHGVLWQGQQVQEVWGGLPEPTSKEGTQQELHWSTCCPFNSTCTCDTCDQSMCTALEGFDERERERERERDSSCCSFFSVFYFHFKYEKTQELPSRVSRRRGLTQRKRG